MATTIMQGQFEGSRIRGWMSNITTWTKIDELLILTKDETDGEHVQLLRAR